MLVALRQLIAHNRYKTIERNVEGYTAEEIFELCCNGYELPFELIHDIQICLDLIERDLTYPESILRTENMYEYFIAQGNYKLEVFL